jgi:hypothetical protein
VRRRHWIEPIPFNRLCPLLASSMAASSSAAPADTYDIPWVEKYRPTRVADVVGNADAVARLQVIARDGNMPNLILSVSARFSLPRTPTSIRARTLLLTPYIIPFRCWIRGLRGLGKRRASSRWPTSCSALATARLCWSSTPPTTGCCHRT